MFPASMRLCSVLLASAAVLVSDNAFAQAGAQTPLPPVTIDAPQQKRVVTARAPRSSATPTRASRRPATATPQTAQAPSAPGSLTVATAQQALREIQQTPGGVALVTADAWKYSTVGNTIKDILDYVPGVFAQPKWGDDTRLSIRGSSLSRNFHLRGVQLYMDGIPINTADGYGDFREIHPTPYKYVGVLKGAEPLPHRAKAVGARL